MAPRPAKRQRRSPPVEDDDEEYQDAILSLKQSPKSGEQLELNYSTNTFLGLSPSKAKSVKSSNGRDSAKSSPKSSPDKARKNSKIKKEPEKIKSIHTFFNKATEEQRWKRKSKTPDDDVSDIEPEDAIEDDDLSDEALLELVKQKEAAINTLDRRKLLSSSSTNGGGSGTATPTSTQKFVKPVAPVNKPFAGSLETGKIDDGDSHRTWADRYGPTTLDELAVHKKKVADVQRWLENVVSGRDRQRLLVLKGPAGSGKTTTLHLLARALGIEVTHWQNPNHSDAGSGGSVAAQLDEFLNRSSNFGTLQFGESASQDDSKVSSDKRILVVEEFPLSVTRSSGSLDSFKSVVLRLLSRSNLNSPSMFRTSNATPGSNPPVVMIISETLLSSSTAFADSFTAHRVLGPEVLNHPLVCVMEFNPVATTFVYKALELTIRKEARDSKRRRVPGPAVLQRLADTGDIRSAVNSLEFLCVRGDQNADWSGTVAAMSRSNKDNVPLTEGEKSSLQLISQRETTLHIFHAAGKVVHNKREDPRIQDPRAEPPPKPPDHLMYLYNPKMSQVDIEALFNETGTDIQTFISTLHENYVLSCNGEQFIDSFEGCAEILSMSNILNPDSRFNRRSRRGNAALSQADIQAGTSDTLRQDEISFQAATRGLLFSLPYPVNRVAPSSGRKADAFKIFYPTSLRLWKPTEEIDSLISLITSEFFTNQPGTHKFTNSFSSTDGVASWKARSTSFATDSHSDAPPIYHPPSREDLTLSILPYMKQILSGRKDESHSRALTRITQFHGMHIHGDEPSDEEPDDDQPPTPSKPIKPVNSLLRLKQVKPKEKDKDKELNALEKLYISDDDIQDD